MSAAGYGDVMAKFVAQLDWKLARTSRAKSIAPDSSP
jgi:glycerol dehydrogenase-like iron-containing ADH family enzyme